MNLSDRSLEKAFSLLDVQAVTIAARTGPAPLLAKGKGLAGEQQQTENQAN